MRQSNLIALDLPRFVAILPLMRASRKAYRENIFFKATFKFCTPNKIFHLLAVLTCSYLQFDAKVEDRNVILRYFSVSL